MNKNIKELCSDWNLNVETIKRIEQKVVKKEKYNYFQKELSKHEMVGELTKIIEGEINHDSK